MSDYLRNTRSLNLESIPANIRESLNFHLEEFNLGSILDDYLFCIETISIKKKKGLIKGPGSKQLLNYAILTPTWLVMAIEEDNAKAGAMSIRLADAVVEDYGKSRLNALMPDNGYTITGIFTGQIGFNGIQQVSVFLGLGEERAAKEFGEALMEGIKNTRR